MESYDRVAKIVAPKRLSLKVCLALSSPGGRRLAWPGFKPHARQDTGLTALLAQ